METAPGQYVQMQMKHRLSDFSAVIDHDAEIIIALLFGHFTGFEHHMAEYVPVFVVGIGQFGKRVFGYKQNMHRRLWWNVFKSQTMFVFVDNISRNFPIDDFRENSHFLSFFASLF